jgi:predicted HAD superfamily Cof-like phosphohydrolase
MKHPYEYTLDFHRRFGHPVRTKPEVPSAAERLLRVKLVLEEAMEFAEASGFPAFVYIQAPNRSWIALDNATPEHQSAEPNLVGAADGLGDLNVVVNGSALVWGIPIDIVDAEVYRSNMSKLGADGKPIQTPEGKIVKGPNYTPPNIKGVLGIE